METRINDLKKTVFYEMLNMAGRVFILVKHSGKVTIGSRGFTQEEMENGIVLVFNQTMNFTWDNAGISAALAFGAAFQRCFIPADDIVMIYSPELNSQFVTASKPQEKEKAFDDEEVLRDEKEKVVKIDFNRKHRRHDNQHES